MKEIRPIQKHLLSLPPCPTCGGYRYLIAVTKSIKNVEIAVKCMKKKGKHIQLQKQKSLTLIPRSMLNAHDSGKTVSRDADSSINSERELIEVATRVVTEYLQKRKLVTK